jgi:hypothetical protein
MISCWLTPMTRNRSAREISCGVTCTFLGEFIAIDIMFKINTLTACVI